MSFPSMPTVARGDSASSFLRHFCCSSLAHCKKPTIARRWEEKKTWALQFKNKSLLNKVYTCVSSLHEGFCCDRHVAEGSWASISSHAEKGNCIWAIWVYPSLSRFHFLILHWNLMLKHHFLQNIWEMWDLISDWDSVFFLISRHQVLVSGWWTGCLLNHCIHGICHTFRKSYVELSSVRGQHPYLPSSSGSLPALSCFFWELSRYRDIFFT